MLLKPPPDIYGSVLAIGGGSPTREGPPVAKVGGFWSEPNLGLSYLLAARHVIEKGSVEHRLNEVALPVAYLQRHAYEVALKGVLEASYRLKTDEAWLQLLKADPRAERPTQTKVPPQHRFDELLKLLAGALAEINYGGVPSEVQEMSKRLGQVEDFEPTRLRYLTLRSGAQSFPQSVLLHVGETQEQLEAVFENVFVYKDVAGANENLVTSLAYEGMAMDQALLKFVSIDEL